MNERAKISLFQGKEIRKTLHEKEWWFSVYDVVGVLTDSKDPREYFNKVLQRDEVLNSTYGQFVHKLPLLAEDGKMRNQVCANTEGLFRIIQSIPSPKAEPFKLWLAKVGYERMQEIADPERSLNRAREYWRQRGRSEKWIRQRMLNQETRNKLTDYWGSHDIKQGEEFAILTNIIHKEWADLSVKEHKDLKGLKDQNLRDHMSDAELIFSALAEFSTCQIAESVNATGMDENEIAGKQGGSIAKNARVELEEKTGKQVVTGKNFLEAEGEAGKLE